MFCGPVNIKSIPDDLVKELLDDFWKIYNSVKPGWYFQQFERTKKNIAYIEGTDNNIENSGSVSFYQADTNLVNKLLEFYKSEFFMYSNMMYQVVTGGPYIAPHVDDSFYRKQGCLCILVQGGNNVKTNWYLPKKDYADLEIPEATAIPYHNLDLVEEHHLEANKWYFGDFSIIHSVENLEGTRVSIVPRR